jgi:pimeloyl-ACP methyl ester carboxylesterase
MRERLRSHVLAIAGREVAAYARQALLIRHDVEAPVIPAEARDGDDVIVLLHGMFATAGVLRPLREAIAQHQAPAMVPPIHTAAVSYPFAQGICAAADRLASALSTLPAGVRLHLCGHSLGGVVCRYYALEAGDARVAQTLSMATPFGGVPGARLLGMECARDLEPSSRVLRRILLGADGAPPHMSIVAGSDALVRSPVAHALPGGEVRVMEGRGHSALLFDREVAVIILRRVLELRRAARAASGRSSPPGAPVPGDGNVPVAAA